VVFWAGFGALILSLGAAGAQLAEVARKCFAVPAVIEVGTLTSRLGAALTRTLWILAPILAAVTLAAILAGVAQSRGLFTAEPLKPKLKKLNPLSGLKNILGKQSLFGLLKTTVVFTAASVVAYLTLKQLLPQILRTAGGSPQALAWVMWEGLYTLGVRLGLLFIAAGAADYAYQHHSHRKKLMMTKYEVQKELKETEGDPQRKARRRELHDELVQQAALGRVSEADFVVVNPVRLAVAMRYKSGQDQAPVVLAKGRHLMAERIRRTARRAGIPIFRDIPLARALWELEVDQEIPEPLYEAVAAVLRVVLKDRDADSYADRTNDTRGNDTRGNDTRGNDTRGNE
jgi:flagellar biosynthesis protein FlhB